MPWGPTPIFNDILAPPGWSGSIPSGNNPSIPGWWVGIDLDTFFTVQFVSTNEFKKIATLGNVVAFSFTRSLTFQAIYKMAQARGINVTVDLGLKGIYMFHNSRTINFSAAETFTKVAPITLSRQINMTVEMAFAKIRTLDESRPISFGANMTLVPVFRFDTPRSFQMTRTMTLLSVFPLTMSRQQQFSAMMSFGFRPTAEVTTIYSTVANNQNISLVRWSNAVDLIALGGGGGGQGSGCCFINGFGAAPGVIDAMTLVRGTDMPWSQVLLQLNVGGGGGGGMAGAGAIPGIPGGPGGNTSWFLNGTEILRGEGGAGGALGVWGADVKGGSVAPLAFNGKNYTGGAGGQSSGANGTAPGGGAAAGAGGFAWGTGGGNGGRGQAWMRSYQ